MRKTNELWTFKLCMRYIGTSEVPVSSCVKMAMDAMKKDPFKSSDLHTSM